MAPEVVNVIASAILIGVIVGAVVYIYKAKKNGKKCIGCPDGCNCGKSGSCSSCHFDVRYPEE